MKEQILYLPQQKLLAYSKSRHLKKDKSKFSCDILASVGRFKSHDSLQFCIPNLDEASIVLY